MSEHSEDARSAIKQRPCKGADEVCESADTAGISVPPRRGLAKVYRPLAATSNAAAANPVSLIRFTIGNLLAPSSGACSTAGKCTVNTISNRKRHNNNPASRESLLIRKEMAAAIMQAPVIYTQKTPPGRNEGTIFAMPVPFIKWLRPKKPITRA